MQHHRIAINALMAKFNLALNLAYAYNENGEVQQVFVYFHSESKKENKSTD